MKKRKWHPEYPESKLSECEFCLKKECLFVYTAHESPDDWGMRDFSHSCNQQIDKFHSNYTRMIVYFNEGWRAKGCPSIEEQQRSYEEAVNAHIKKVEAEIEEKKVNSKSSAGND